MIFEQYHSFIVDEHIHTAVNKHIMDVISYLQCLLNGLHKLQQQNPQAINHTQKHKKNKII